MGYKYTIVYCNKGDIYANHKIFKHHIFALLYYWYCNLKYDFVDMKRRIKK